MYDLSGAILFSQTTPPVHLTAQTTSSATLHAQAEHPGSSGTCMEHLAISTSISIRRWHDIPSGLMYPKELGTYGSRYSYLKQQSWTCLGFFCL